MPSQFANSTYGTCALWQADTKIEYVPNPKSGKSFHRYAAYEKSRSIEASMNNGSKPADLLWDYEKGLMKVLGPLRKERLYPHKMTPADLKGLKEADLVLLRYGCRHDPKVKPGSGDQVKNLLGNLKTLRDGGKHIKRLSIANKCGLDSTEDLDECLSGECYSLRLNADREAKKVLAEIATSKRKITEHEVVRVLGQWGFARNPNRINVMREGVSWVHSDTIGAMARRDGLILPTPPTRKFPNFVKVITKYLADALPEELKGKFVFTSININKDYAGARHRDQGNVGPSVLKALGDFSGGQLVYYPSDDHTGKVEALPKELALKLDVKKGIALFDGNRAHEVEDFKRNRYSLVFFTCKRFWKMPSDKLAQLKEMGITYPTTTSMDKLKAMLEEPQKCKGTAGKKNKNAREKALARDKKRDAKFPGYGYWPTSKKAEALELVAQKVWKKRPLENVDDVRQIKKTGEVWNVNQQIALGATPMKQEHAILKGYNTVEDAVAALRKEVPKDVAKRGYFVVYGIRYKVYYLVYHSEHRAAALQAAGFSADTLLGEARSAGLQRIKAARKAQGA